MSYRNIPVTSQTIEHLHQSVQGPPSHGPGVIGGNIRNSLQCNAQVTLPVPVPVNAPVIGGHLLPEQYNNSIPFGIPPYSAIVPHPAASSVTHVPSFYNPYMNPGTFSALPTCGPYAYMPFHWVVGIPSDEFGRSSFIYGPPSKVKNAESHGYIQNSETSTSSGSAADSSNVRYMEPGPAVTVPDQFPQARYLMTPIPATMEVGSRVNVVDRPGALSLDSFMVPGPIYMVAGRYLGETFLPAGHVWSQLPAAPLLPGGNVSRSASGPMTVQGYRDMASNISTNFLPHISRGATPQALPPPMHIVGTPNVNFYQVPGPSYRIPVNIPHGRLNPPQEGLHPGLRHQDTDLPTGIRIYRPQRGTFPDATVRSHGTPYLRVMPREEIAELVIPDNYEEIADDRHRDMRMDTENMSYEELLALGDQIGNVSIGLTVEAIRKHLKTRIHVRSSNTSRGKLVTESHDFDPCIICQSNFEDEEMIGILSCRHEYHAGCLEKWLLVKNGCPVCKSSALVIEEKSKM